MHDDVGGKLEPEEGKTKKEMPLVSDLPEVSSKSEPYKVQAKDMGLKPG
jgi:hypothetical protein